MSKNNNEIKHEGKKKSIQINLMARNTELEEF